MSNIKEELDTMDMQWQELAEKAKFQGYLTYEDICDFLPDEGDSSEQLNRLLSYMDKWDVRLVEEAPSPSKPDFGPDLEANNDHSNAESEVQLDFENELTSGTSAPDGNRLRIAPPSEDESRPAEVGNLRPSDDPIRTYLAQMAKIPLLSREQEIVLAKKIEITRKKFRRTLLGSHFSLVNTVKILHKVHKGDLPFDRTIKISLTEQLSKEQITARMPHNLATLDHLAKKSSDLFARLIRKSTPSSERKKLRKELASIRQKTLVLVEELSLRTKRIRPLITQLKEFSQQMLVLQRRIQDLKGNTRFTRQYEELRKKFRHLLCLTQESPKSLAKRCEQIENQLLEYEYAKRDLSSGNLRLVVSIAKKY
ncbi:MAG: RNA polymerase subunit sigma-70, partial [Pirellulaceae bacterium]|nr:RNA polymerase subunit sigma-70 [Pirellulaceae bacterium]